MQDQITLRAIRKEDCPEISKQFAAQGWNKSEAQYLNYYAMQEAGTRDIILAELAGQFAGYLTIQWESGYPLFKDRNIPEIVDFNVLKKFQRRGIGTLLMDEAESRIQRVSKYAGIGFGLYKDYGAAQILYIKRNYIPDGNGLVKDSRSIEAGEKVLVDDGLVMYLMKKL